MRKFMILGLPPFVSPWGAHVRGAVYPSARPAQQAFSSGLACSPSQSRRGAQMSRQSGWTCFFYGGRPAS